MSDFLDSLDGLLRRYDSGRDRASRQIGVVVTRVARSYAPMSPSQTQKNRLRKTTRAVTRKARATTRAKPGGLTRSITHRADRSQVEIFVPRNSEAGAYAWKMHEEKGISWSNRGPGTIAKGAQADDRFIERAIDDSARDIETILEGVL